MYKRLTQFQSLVDECAPVSKPVIFLLMDKTEGLLSTHARET
jgi:hypothetical protein